MKKYFIKKNKFLKNIDPHEVLLDSLSQKNKEKWGSSAKKIETPLLKSVFKSFFFFSVAVIFVLFIRVFQLQVVKGEEYLKGAHANKYISSNLDAERGVIYDRNFNQLVKNVSIFNLVCEKNDLPESKEEKNLILQEIALILDISKEEIEKKINDSSQSPIIIFEKLEHRPLITLKAKIEDLDGFAIEERLFREYKDGQVYSHVIGYMSKINQEELEEDSSFYSLFDYVGRSGLEQFYEKYLRRVPGQKRIERDVLGNIFSEEIITFPQSGKDLVLYLDADLQYKIQEVLNFYLNSIDGNRAAAVAIDPQTGGILSLVSIPSFDNNIFSMSSESEINQILNDKEVSPLFNRAIRGRGYATGSVIKPFIALAALEEKVVDPDYFFNCQEFIEIEHLYDPEIIYRYHDWEIHGWTDMRKAIAQSSNVYFYSIGGGNEEFKIDGLGSNNINKYFKLFGFGEKTGIDLPNEGRSVLPVVDYNWTRGNTYHLSIGQGDFSVLPIQIANAYAAIANGGTLFRPRIVDKIVQGTTPLQIVEDFEPEIIRDSFFSEENIKVVQEGMRQAVTGKNSPLASATLLNGLPVSSAAKTGTAQVSKEDFYNNWVTVFAPYEDPQIVLTIMFEDVSGIRAVSVPAARDILDWYFD